MQRAPRVMAAVFLGGFAGAITRALLVEQFPADPGHWPWVTFAVNVAGAFALGWLMVALPLASYGRPLLGTGLCGALTTFSTMQLELLDMLDDDRVALAVGYAAASVAAGLLAVAAATGLAHRAQRA